MPVMESKAADVFAFAMFSVEVFTGKIPFGEQKNEAVVVRISQGGRPEMPENAQEVGLTSDMWVLLESCWQQNPNKRPSMGEVVRKWQGFVANGDDGAIEYVLITLVVLTTSPAPSSALMIDLGTHSGRDPHIDHGRKLTPPNLHRGRPPDPERGPTSSNPSLKTSDSEPLPRHLDQLGCLRSPNQQEDPRSLGSRLHSRPQSARLGSRECRSSIHLRVGVSRGEQQFQILILLIHTAPQRKKCFCGLF